MAFGTNCSSSTALRTFDRVSTPTYPRFEITRETVAGETPARLATSRIVVMPSPKMESFSQTLSTESCTVKTCSDTGCASRFCAVNRHSPGGHRDIGETMRVSGVPMPMEAPRAADGGPQNPHQIVERKTLHRTLRHVRANVKLRQLLAATID